MQFATGVCALVMTIVGAVGAGAEDDFPLAGNYTQNAPCKGDGSDPADIQVKISVKEIDSNVGVCTFLDAKRDGDNINAHVECRLADGPLMGDITFTLRPDHTIGVIDRDKTYSAVLYRCPQ